jgi:hypothetical protein
MIDKIQQSPKRSNAHRGTTPAYSGRRQEGCEAIRQHLRLSPRDPARPIRLSQIAELLYFDGNFDFDGNFEAAAATARQDPSMRLCWRACARPVGRSETKSGQLKGFDLSGSLQPGMRPCQCEGAGMPRSEWPGRARPLRHALLKRPTPPRSDPVRGSAACAGACRWRRRSHW